MARPRLTVRQLAAEAGCDLDEALITLWDNNIDVGSANSVIRRGDTNKARRAIGIATRRELSSIAFWQSLFGLDYAKFNSLLEELNIPLDSGERRLTKKVINKLRAESRARGVYAFEESPIIDSPPEPPKPLDWETIGKAKELHHLDTETITAIHYQLAEDFAEHHDPIDPPGVRRGGLLESAVLRPQTSLGEIKKYPSAEMAAAALMHSLVHNHPFHNGNKRSALVSTLVFLDKNGLLVTCSDTDLFRLILKVAQHSILPSYPMDNIPDREVLVIAKWIKDNSRVIEGGERTIPFRRLRRILTRYDCETSIKGSTVNISRSVVKRRFLSTTQQQLSTLIAYNDEGRDVEKGTIAKIRRDLELDDLHGGIDSASFYDNAPDAADGFIVKYRKILHRLAQL